LIVIPHAIKAPLASAFVLPGVGQVINRQIAKAVALILGAGIYFAVSLFLALRELARALRAPAVGNAPEGEGLKALSAQLHAQGSDWLWILASIWMLIWCYGVFDALIWGRRIDLAQRQG
jgi:hypothetical protein